MHKEQSKDGAGLTAADARWTDIWKLYSYLRDAPEQERDAALRSAADDVRREVLALLEQSQSNSLSATAAPPAVATLSGTLAGRYVLTGLIGQGGCGSVYAADDRELRRRVAIKVLTTRLAGEELLSEARSASALNHPNILTIYDTIEVDGYAAM